MSTFPSCDRNEIGDPLNEVDYWFTAELIQEIWNDAYTRELFRRVPRGGR